MIKTTDMRLADLERLKENLAIDYDDFWSFQVFKNELLNPNSRYIVAKNDSDEILGFAGIWKVLDEVHITNIVVKKDVRSQGIGSILLNKLIDICKTYDEVTSITLEVKATNLPAIKLYEKYNFKKVGIRKKYYLHKEDALIMTMEVIK